MWIVRLALRRPYTFVVMAVLILILGPLAILRTPTDIFPNIGIPVISVVWNYTGLPAQDMTDRITTVSERAMTTLVNDIDHIESQTIDGSSVIKIFFHPEVNLSAALAQVTAISQTELNQLPPHTTPPIVITYNASTVPILQLALSGAGLSEQTLNDIAKNFLRNDLATVEGAALPWPYGGKVRQIQVDLDPAALRARGLAPLDVVNAINAQNLILPSGTAKIGGFEYDVDMNASTTAVAALNNLPLKTVNGTTIFIRDVAHVRDGYPPQTNIARVDGQRAAIQTVYKSGNASTLAIIAQVKALLPQIAATLPPELRIAPLADQSVFVRGAIHEVIREAVIAAGLTALMILLFLGSWRSTLIIAVSIPLSALTSLIVLSALGETINIMTLGGLALAVGILVDDATVAIESINYHLEQGKMLEPAIIDGQQQIALPALVSTLSICIVFVPTFFLAGVTHYLFAPLAEAVVFAMLASYVLSRTLVTTMAKYLLRREQARRGERAGLLLRLQRRYQAWFERRRAGYREALGACLRHRRAFTLLFFAACLGSFLLAPWLGEDFFPPVDSGQFILHVRAPIGTRIERTAALCDRVEATIRRQIAPGEVANIIDIIGAPYSSINRSYGTSGTIGPEDADIEVSLTPTHHPTEAYERALRPKLAEEFPGVEFAFLPADIVSQILNFGLPAPIDVQVIGPDVSGNRLFADRLLERLRTVSGAADLRIQQAFNYPRLHLDVDRTEAAQVGLTQNDIATDLLVSLSGSFQTEPNYWLDPANGVSYSVAVQTPEYRLDSLQDLRNIPLAGGSGGTPEILGNLASLQRTVEPALISHYNVQPVIDIYGSAAGRDLGGVARDITRIVNAHRGEVPRGSQVLLRGQIETMFSSFQGLLGGLAFAIVLVYLLIVVNFQSWLDPLIIISALPAALAGIVWCLFMTHTTLSVPALIGSIMCIGIATANSILVVSFAKEQIAEGKSAAEAALAAGFTRFRPVLMTALAMILGMVPMATSGEQNAALGRAVIGGLTLATMATLFFVPVCFRMLYAGRETAHIEGEA